MYLNGLEIKPIRNRKTLYLLIPMDIAKLLGVTKDTRLQLQLKLNPERCLIYRLTGKETLQQGALREQPPIQPVRDPRSEE